MIRVRLLKVISWLWLISIIQSRPCLYDWEFVCDLMKAFVGWNVMIFLFQTFLILELRVCNTFFFLTLDLHSQHLIFVVRYTSPSCVFLLVITLQRWLTDCLWRLPTERLCVGSPSVWTVNRAERQPPWPPALLSRAGGLGKQRPGAQITWIWSICWTSNSQDTQDVDSGQEINIYLVKLYWHWMSWHWLQLLTWGSGDW